MNINSYKPAPVFGYNSEGKKHRAPIDVLQWLDGEIAEAEQYQAQFNKRAEETQYTDYENETERHWQDGWVACLRYTKQYLEARHD